MKRRAQLSLPHHIFTAAAARPRSTFFLPSLTLICASFESPCAVDSRRLAIRADAAAASVERRASGAQERLVGSLTHLRRSGGGQVDHSTCSRAGSAARVLRATSFVWHRSHQPRRRRLRLTSAARVGRSARLNAWSSWQSDGSHRAITGASIRKRGAKDA